MALGLVGSERAEAYRVKAEGIEDLQARLNALTATPKELAVRGLTINQDGRRRSALEVLAYPGVGLSRLRALWPDVIPEVSAAVGEQMEIKAQYAGYLDRQEADIRAFRREESLALPTGLDYDRIGSLSNEVRLKLKQARPETLGAAARIPGMTPAALTALMGHVKQKAS